MVKLQPRDLGHAQRPDAGALHHRPVLVKVQKGVQISHIARQRLLIHHDFDGVGCKDIHVQNLDKGNSLYSPVPVFQGEIKGIIPKPAVHDNVLDLLLGVMDIALDIDGLYGIFILDINAGCPAKHHYHDDNSYHESYLSAFRHLPPALLTL